MNVVFVMDIESMGYAETILKDAMRKLMSEIAFLAMFETYRLTDRPTNQTIDGQMDKPSYRDARTHLKYGM